jgi:parallel beta-helix repeat protein
MNKKIRLAGLVLVLGFLLCPSFWQQKSKAAGQQGETPEPPSSPATPFVPEPYQTSAAVAGTITVTSNQDGAANAANCPGPNCRLRDAIAKATAGDTINFSVTGTITLNSGELSIDKNLTINGPGAAQLTVSGNNANRVFRTQLFTDVNLNGMTIANGSVSDSGGGIYNADTLTVTNCTLSGNSADDGAGIFSLGGLNQDTLTVTNCTVSGNSAGITGGAIANISGNMTIVNCTVSGNQGGGIFNGTDQNLTMAGSTISGNSNTGHSGGLFNAGDAFLTNCTISGNSTPGNGGGIYNGDGVFTVHRSLFLTNCTISNNMATGGISEGCGIYNASSVIRARNTIIAGNTAIFKRADFSGSLSSLGHNLIGDTVGVPISGDTVGNLRNVGAALGPLANNGGATQTHALSYCSPAINAGADVTTLTGAINSTATTITLADARAFPGLGGFVIQIDNEQMLITGKAGNQLTVTRGTNSTTAAAHGDGAGVNPAFDQRGAGFSRQLGGAPDIGAFEGQSGVPAPLVVANNNDSGPGSLREAIANASQCTTITFANGISFITLTSAELIIDKSLTINGPGANLLTISGNGARRVFTVNRGASVVLNGLTIANGAAGSNDGGGIINNGYLTVTNCTLAGNSADDGGGIHNTGFLTVSNSTISGNSASTGGGINDISSFSSTLTNCTLSGNVATSTGGALIVFSSAATITLTNCTLSGNQAQFGGGISISSGTVKTWNTLIAGNTAPSSGPDVRGTLTSQGHNLIGNGSSATITPTTGDQIGTAAAPINPLLGPLANNGGPTQTRPLLNGSPALNAGDNCVTQTPGCLTTPLTTDQRGTGFNRLVGSAVDIGSFEQAANTAPMFSPAAAIGRQQGSPAGAAVTVGTVTDAQTAAGSLTVTQIAGGTATGITVTGITNTNGTITATVSASCSATVGTVRFQVSDSSLTGTGDLQVNVTTNTTPTLTYGTVSVNAAASTTNSPTTATDNGSITGYTVQSQGTYTGTISVNASGVVSISNAAPVGNHTITIRATDNCGATTNAQFMLTVNSTNTAPTFTPAAAISRQQGSPAGAAITVGTVSDAQTAAASLTVTQIAGGTATGITVTSITNTGGTITAMVSASCTATAGTVRFQVSDGSLTGTGNLQVNITANTAPTLTYGTASASLGGSTTNSPTTATDNGNISSYTVQSQGTYTGTISVNASGVVSISNATPAGNHTITIRATDNCSATTNAQFMLTVNNCGASLSKTALNFAANGGTANFTVTIDGACQWTAVSNDPGFVTIVSPLGQQTGPGTVSFSVASHTNTAPRNGTITVAGQTFTVRQGAQFLDVPVGASFYEEIGKLSAVGITQGCGDSNYCPNINVSREQMAAFIIRALHAPGYVPPPPATQRFLDVSSSNPFYAHIEEMAVRQITLGCGGGNYCPATNVTREQMAAFIIRALHEPGYVPPTPGMQRFADVPPSHPFYAFIEEMAVRQITLGCGGGNYCPTTNVTREQMAAFLVRALGL